jgi:hypothetical protein
MSAQALAQASTGVDMPLPEATTLLTAAKLSQSQDKPIHLDYYADSKTKSAFIGQDKDTGDKILVKNNEEYTSLINKTYKTGNDFLVLTENSIYIVHGNIEKKYIAATKMLAESDDY